MAYLQVFLLFFDFVLIFITSSIKDNFFRSWDFQTPDRALGLSNINIIPKD